MGGCTEICSDKTGTLTANKMTAVAFWVEGKNHDNSEIRNSTGDDNATIHKDIAQLKTIKEIADAVLINSSAYESVDAKTGELELKGNPTEKALFQFFTKAYQLEHSVLVGNLWSGEDDTLNVFSSLYDVTSMCLRFDGIELVRDRLRTIPVVL